jgi:DNA topoisomerase I
MKLVIVESPTKAKTISKFLGKDYKVESSYGHVRDLPRSKLGVDVENNFEPQYVIPTKVRKNVNQLKKLVAKSADIILATDEDREGEAIAWHLAQALGLITDDRQPTTDNPPSTPKVERIVFHEITESAIRNALANPRAIDDNLVAAQQARRVLDRLVGYKLSPFLWKKVAKGLSAGRVQSVAVRLIVEREEEIRAFKPQEYWTIEVIFKTERGDTFKASLAKINGETVKKFDIGDKEKASQIAGELLKASAQILDVTKKETSKNPLPPFTTSTLQQGGASRLGYSAKKTMFLAQKLYEKGLITYMRTDSLNLSKDSLAAAKSWLEKSFGEKYSADAPRFFKGKSRLAQEAHEAIRPTDINKTPETLKLKEAAEKKMYTLIWQRFTASQMPKAVFDATTVDIQAKNENKEYALRANGNILKFDGYLKVWPQNFSENELPTISRGETLETDAVNPEQHFTEPPPRYSEATLVKALEEHGIGRPSTYAPIISTVQTRNYVHKEKGRLHPTEIGELVNKVLVEHFPNIVDIEFTAKMEEDLDMVAEGKEKWQKSIGDFYGPFEKHLEEKYESVEKAVADEETDEKCEKCEKLMVIKFGRFGKFLACSGFPDCKNTKTLSGQKAEPKKTGIKCEKCGEGELVERRVSRGRARGKMFWGCNRYPECDEATWENPAQAKEEKSTEPDDSSSESESS